MANLIFGYRTLRNAGTRKKVIGYKVDAKPAIAEGYKKETWSTPEGKGFDTMVPHKGEAVSGVRFEVDDEGLAKLNAWEDEYKQGTCQLSTKEKAICWYLKDKYKLKQE